jgi:predicted RNA binding protein YcfA (HicA-like mRNA interferase family)
MKARELLRILEREPLCYVVERRTGSHMRLTSQRGYQDLTFAFHDKDMVPPGLVRKILVKDVGLTVDDAIGLL